MVRQNWGHYTFLRHICNLIINIFEELTKSCSCLSLFYLLFYFLSLDACSFQLSELSSYPVITTWSDISTYAINTVCNSTSFEMRQTSIWMQFNKLNYYQYIKLTHLKRLWCWKRLRVEGEGGDRGWDGWIASPTEWPWVWVDPGSWWWVGRSGMLLFIGLQRVGQDWATELNWTITICSPLLASSHHD